MAHKLFSISVVSGCSGCGKNFNEGDEIFELNDDGIPYFCCANYECLKKATNADQGKVKTCDCELNQKYRYEHDYQKHNYDKLPPLENQIIRHRRDE